MNSPQSEILNPQSRERPLSTAFHDVETVVGNHTMRPLSLASWLPELKMKGRAKYSSQFD